MSFHTPPEWTFVLLLLLQRSLSRHGWAAYIGQTRTLCVYYALRDCVASCCASSAVSESQWQSRRVCLGLPMGETSWEVRTRTLCCAMLQWLCGPRGQSLFIVQKSSQYFNVPLKKGFCSVNAVLTAIFEKSKLRYAYVIFTTAEGFDTWKSLDAHNFT